MTALEVGSRKSEVGRRKSGVGGKDAEETDIVAEEFIVERPAFQIIDRRRFALLTWAVDDKQAEKVGPGGFQHGLGLRTVPDLMLVSFLVR